VQCQPEAYAVVSPGPHDISGGGRGGSPPQGRLLRWKRMANVLTLQLNGRPRGFETLTDPSTLEQVLTALELKPDRIAVELNGEIARREAWPQVEVRSGDRLEIVHFVGGGLG
jgi:sulfur carrier protein